MKRMFLTSLAVAAIGPAAVVEAQPASGRHFGVYRYLYRHALAKFGPQAVGCELMYTCHGQLTEARVRRSTDVLQRMLWPPAIRRVVYRPAAAATSVATATAVSSPAPTYSGGGASGVPACASESGTNYSTGSDNTNPSGATGRYQILPSTAAGYGCNLSTPAGQDACASVIYAHQGAGAWVGCGG